MKRWNGRVADRCSADLRQHEAFALRFWDRIAKFFRGINPQLDGFIGMRERRCLRETGLRKVAVNLSVMEESYQHKDILFDPQAEPIVANSDGAVCLAAPLIDGSPHL